ncbi:MAG: hypothetical protein LBN95_02890 [Prevotellaceae bacterium]|jgi:hypothetical protein|nr:hypothetical protein [Prevotellaceae bacterium]
MYQDFTNRAGADYCSAMERETILKNRVIPKNVRSRRNLVILVVLSIFFLSSINGYAQSSGGYKSYDACLSAFKEVSKNKGFSAIKDKYVQCKNLEDVKSTTFDESLNDFLGRMDITIIWYYNYSGCYFRVSRYTGSAKIIGYITRDSDGTFKYSIKTIEVLHYDD